MAGQTNGSSPHKRGEKFMRYAMDAHGGSVYLVALAQRMAGVELTLSASLANGSVQTRRYRFDPVEGARERYAAYLGQITDLELQREVEGTDTSAQVQELMGNPPSLYLVTELDG